MTPSPKEIKERHQLATYGAFEYKQSGLVWQQGFEAHQDRGTLLTLLESAHKQVEAYREALEFYADPWGRRDEHGDLIPVPDFYSELEFGERAREVLRGKE